MTSEIPRIERVRVLSGHADPESAYVVEDYPYGWELCCRIRYWIQTAAKGAKKGQQRMVSQTTNPKAPGEPWNKPKGSGYTGMVVLYLNSDDHVKHWGAGLRLNPASDARMRLMGIYEQLTDDQREHYDTFLALSRRYQPPWNEFEQRVTAIMRYIKETGADPQVTNGVWTAPDGQMYYLYDDPATHVTMARQRLATSG